MIVGRGGYLTAGMARLDQRVRVAEQLAASLRALVPGLDEAQIARAKDEFTAALPPFGGDTAIGLVPNLAASRIANRLDLGGGAYTVDAACASALVAVDQAARDLAEGRADLVIAGGVHLCHDPTFWSVFCQLGALSRSEAIRPFDRRADGLLIGEGVGMVVLRRLADAERDGDRIYAVIRGAGVSSDGRGASLMTPAVEGQVRALRRAWEQAGADPASVGLVEAHGTGTPAGDAAEIETLRRFFGEADPAGPRAVLGSVKSMIGHAMPAAGIAGLIKAALAVHGKVLPPSLHCEEPREELARTRFRVIGEAAGSAAATRASARLPPAGACCAARRCTSPGPSRSTSEPRSNLGQREREIQRNPQPGEHTLPRAFEVHKHAHRDDLRALSGEDIPRVSNGVPGVQEVVDYDDAGAALDGHALDEPPQARGLLAFPDREPRWQRAADRAASVSTAHVRIRRECDAANEVGALALDCAPEQRPDAEEKIGAHEGFATIEDPSQRPALLVHALSSLKGMTAQVADTFSRTALGSEEGSPACGSQACRARWSCVTNAYRYLVRSPCARERRTP